MLYKSSGVLFPFKASIRYCMNSSAVFNPLLVYIFLVSIMVIIIPSMNDIKKRFDVYYAIANFTNISFDTSTAG